MTEISNDEKIKMFVDAGSAPLRTYVFVSDKLNAAKPKVLMKTMAAVAAVGDGNPDSEKGVQFRLNQTGNVFYSTTSPELTAETKNLFDSVTVLFVAMTKALADKKKDLFDYTAWSEIIGKSGFFVEVQKLEKHLHIETSSVTIDTQIVQQLLPGLQSGNSMEIAKSVLNAINGEYKSSKMDEDTKLGHLLFICEELFGAPTVTVRLFYVEKKTHVAITSTPCYTTTNVTIDQLQEANTFLFVSPETIAKYAPSFNEKPEAMATLVATLSSYIDAPAK